MTADPVRSPTQLDLGADDIAAVVTEGLGPVPVIDAVELTGGRFATVWRAELGDGRQVVVKVGPPKSARLLAYEKGLIVAESDYSAWSVPTWPLVAELELLAAR